MPKVSIIIPCFNQGHFIDEAVDSVLAQSFDDIEIIVVNDGSTDSQTIALLANYTKSATQVLHTDNQGLAAARNNGIKVAAGEYILPLDADDKIAPDYIEKAVAILEQRPEVGIVYCRAQLFGAVDTEWLLPKYSLDEMLLDNVIFCTALYRRRDWEKVGGYDPGMIYGWEDYDFWLSLIELGHGVYQIPEILFSYRVASDSMVRSKERWQKVAMFKRIFQRHEKLFAEHIEVLLNSLLEVREHYYTSKLYMDTGGGISDEDCISRKVEIGTHEIQFSLNGYKQIKAIRFDPIDTPAIVEIRKIITTNKQGESKEILNYTDNSILQINGDRYFATDDPQCFFLLTQGELEHLDHLTVQLSFKDLADNALQKIVTLQQDMLQAESNQHKHHDSAGLLKAVGKALRKNEGENGLQYLKRQLKLF